VAGRTGTSSRRDGFAGQPGGAALVQAFHLGPAHARHVGLDRVTHPDLQVGQVPVVTSATVVSVLGVTTAVTVATTTPDASTEGSFLRTKALAPAA